MSTQEQLAVSYDISNDFYRLWLDQRMIYSCAVFNHETESLEQAQTNKLRWMHDAAKLSPKSRVLDIGCGWGGNLDFLAVDMRVQDVTGITLSRAQYEEIKQKSTSGVTAHCVSYKDFEPNQPYDGLISIGMFEHLATPEQARSGESMHIYRDYFRRAWEWTKKGSWFALQTVIGARLPRDRSAVQAIGWTTYNVFPGAISPRLETVVASVSPRWEIVELRTRREHYERTAREWLKRLMLHEETIRRRWGPQLFEDYRRYLGACVMAFRDGYQSLAQIALKRVD